MAETGSPLRDFIYLDADRVQSLAAQLGTGVAEVPSAIPPSTADRERQFAQLESALLSNENTMRIDANFDFSGWSNFTDGQLVLATGTVRLLDFSWLALALGGLPAVLRKMSKIELAALKNSDEGRRMSKSQLQQRGLENQTAIAKVEEFKMEELSDVVSRLYADVVRVKVRPSREHPQHVLVGSAYTKSFYDTPAALSQKYGVEIDAGWRILGQLNVPNLAGNPQPIPTGNQMEDAFEQIALLMNSAFRVANAPAPPALSMTPVAIYRAVR